MAILIRQKKKRDKSSIDYSNINNYIYYFHYYLKAQKNDRQINCLFINKTNIRNERKNIMMTIIIVIVIKKKMFLYRYCKSWNNIYLIFLYKHWYFLLLGTFGRNNGHFVNWITVNSNWPLFYCIRILIQ